MEKIEKLLSEILENQKKFDKRLDGMDKRLDGMDKRLDGMDKRLDGMDKRLDDMEKRLDGVEKRLDGMDKRLDGMDKRLDGMDKRLDGMDKRIEKMEVELRKQGMIQERMQRNIELLVEGHNNILETIDRKFDEVKEEFNERLSEVEFTIADLSGDVKFIKHKSFENEENLFKLKESLRIVK
ncbi:MAG: hypothetical protein PWQ37_1766 [Candidatus Petromonas sp.]|jgi:chromosome segregation ATPase|nr:hypothetical protein [Candidatus Petromonas sp.]